MAICRELIHNHVPAANRQALTPDCLKSGAGWGRKSAIWLSKAVRVDYHEEDIRMGEYEHGSMDTTSHERDFAGFVKLATWVCIVSIFVLIFLAVFNS